MLELVVSAEEPPTIADVAGRLGVHRSIAYRILRTLESHGLLTRDSTGRLIGAPGLAVLARGVQQDLQSAALPELTTLANELGMSAFVAVWGQEECITLVTVEPSRGQAVTQRPGTRHPLDRGAPGLAVQAGMDPEELAELTGGVRPRAEVEQTRERGFAVSSNEVLDGVSAVAVPCACPATCRRRWPSSTPRAASTSRRWGGAWRTARAWSPPAWDGDRARRISRTRAGRRPAPPGRTRRRRAPRSLGPAGRRRRPR
ncbi:IclR family transcriptional regulator [Kocuria flava]|uniref:IclR family transcriptional regulator n=1 Tax=Kocuria flava TaxID=446860 RepID=UPI0021515DD8|nr:helix-turn-helix domain-containing protein [Kocuria flava]